MQESEKWKWSRSVLSDSSRPHGLQPTRLLHPWDFPGKSTGVGCHCLLKPQQVRILNTFSWEQALLRKTEYFKIVEVFQNGFFSLPTTRTMRVFFTDIHYEDLVQFLQVKLTEVWRFHWWMGSSWVVHNEPSEIHQWHFWFSHPSTGSQGGFCSCVSALLSQYSLYPPVCLSMI